MRTLTVWSFVTKWVLSHYQYAPLLIFVFCVWHRCGSHNALQPGFCYINIWHLLCQIPTILTVSHCCSIEKFVQLVVSIVWSNMTWYWIAGIILCMCPTNERWHYNVTSSLIGWAHSQHDPSIVQQCNDEIRTIGKTLNSLYKKLHISPSQGSYGVSVMSILEKIWYANDDSTLHYLYKPEFWSGYYITALNRVAVRPLPALCSLHNGANHIVTVYLMTCCFNCIINIAMFDVCFDSPDMI